MERVGFVGVSDAESPAREVLRLGDCDVVDRGPDDGEVDPEEIAGLEDLAELPLIVLSTGISHCRAVARRLGDVVTGRQVVVHTIRGVEADTMQTASEILHDETPTRRIGFLTGPLGLDDLQAGNLGAGQCASHFPEVHDLVDEAMLSNRVRIYHARDLRGAELAAVYGRLVALISGLADQLQGGRSLKATVLTRGLDEMARFVEAMDGTAESAWGLAGVGNLCIDTDRRGDIDFQMGRYLAEDSPTESDELRERFGAPAGELMDVVERFGTAGGAEGLELPMLETLRALLDDRIEPEGFFEHLMGLPAPGS